MVDRNRIRKTYPFLRRRIDSSVQQITYPFGKKDKYKPLLQLGTGACCGCIHFDEEDAEVPTLLEEFELFLNPLSWRLPRTGDGFGGWTVAPGSVVVSDTLVGTPGLFYAVSVRFRGIVEGKAYSGGTDLGDGFLEGGTPGGTSYNEYSLQISSPSKTYWLNSFGADGPCQIIDYTKTIVIAAGATVTLTANPRDFVEASHSLIAPGVTDPAQPYLGQFIVMDVLSVSYL